MSSPDLTMKTGLGIQGCVGVCYIGTTIYATSFTTNLLYIITWDGNNTSPTTFDLSSICSQPHMITTYGTNVYISGYGSNNIIEYDTLNNSASVFVSNVSNPTGICINGDYLYVSLISSNQIIRIDLTNTLIRSVVATINSPAGIIYNNNIFYISSFGDNKVISYNNNWYVNNANLISISNPTGISYFNNYLFVSSNTYNNVTQYSLSGELIVSNFVSGIPNPHQMIFDINYSPKVYAVASYGGNNLNIYTFTNISCFNKGTKILCLNKNLEEEYIAIENLNKGDLVKSYLHGYRKISEIGTKNMFNDPNIITENMFKMEKTKENELLEDLIITGGHSILVDKLTEEENEKQSQYCSEKIDDKCLLFAGLSCLFKPITELDMFSYYHFILENNGDEEERFGVYANGVLVETPSEKNYKRMKLRLLEL